MGRIMYMLLVLLLLFSCEKNDVVSEKLPISFSVLAGSTKSFSEVTTASLQTSGFYVSATLNSEPYFSSSSVEYESGSGGYVFNPKRYYPSSALAAAMKFYCCTIDDVSVANDGSATLDYDVTHEDDLVAGICIGNASGAADVTLNHILAQLVFKCKCKEESAAYGCCVKQITVTSIESGTYSFASETWGSLGGNSDYNVYLNATGIDVPTTDPINIGVGSTYIASTVTVRVVWDVKNKTSGTVAKSFDKNVDIEITKGKRLVATLVLDNKVDDGGFTAETEECDFGDVDWFAY